MAKHIDKKLDGTNPKYFQEEKGPNRIINYSKMLPDYVRHQREKCYNHE